uniref:Uncharacterized protein n=1 Tax=Arundo donax TaxID=35708 RepID=A0A0A9CM05_ARUDO
MKPSGLAMAVVMVSRTAAGGLGTTRPRIIACTGGHTMARRYYSGHCTWSSGSCQHTISSRS